MVHARRVVCIAVFPILADVVEVKTGSRSTAHWRIHFIRSNGWLRHSFAQLFTLLDIDGFGQNWEGSNNVDQILCRLPVPPRNEKRGQHSCLVSSVVEQRGAPSCLPQLPPHPVPDPEPVGAYSASPARGCFSLVAPRALCRMSGAWTAATACAATRARKRPP